MSDPTAASRPGSVRSILHHPAGERAVELPFEGRLASFDGATAWLNSDAQDLRPCRFFDDVPATAIPTSVPGRTWGGIIV